MHESRGLDLPLLRQSVPRPTLSRAASVQPFQSQLASQSRRAEDIDLSNNDAYLKKFIKITLNS